MKVSVCIATYNGAQFLNKQLASILSQLQDDDEIIISDDDSQDDTLNIIESFNDVRIKVYKDNTFHSPIFNFENAIKQASGDIIVLSDQDDVWHSNKIDVIKKSRVKNTIWLKMYNGDCIDKNGLIIQNNLFKYKGVKLGLISNIKKNSFIGCNIAFSKELLNVILPFPKDIPMHDMWIGSCAYLFGDVEFVDENVFSYRLHENNFTGNKTSLMQKIRWRFQLIKNLMLRYFYVKYTA